MVPTHSKQSQVVSALFRDSIFVPNSTGQGGGQAGSLGCQDGACRGSCPAEGSTAEPSLSSRPLFFTAHNMKKNHVLHPDSFLNFYFIT